MQLFRRSLDATEALGSHQPRNNRVIGIGIAHLAGIIAAPKAIRPSAAGDRAGSPSARGPKWTVGLSFPSTIFIHEKVAGAFQLLVPLLSLIIRSLLCALDKAAAHSILVKSLTSGQLPIINQRLTVTSSSMGCVVDRSVDR